MILSEILEGIENVEVKGDLNFDVSEIKCDSRLVAENDMFVAIVGFKTDGHEYIKNAIESGAKVIAVQKDKFNEEVPSRNNISNC